MKNIEDAQKNLNTVEIIFEQADGIGISVRGIHTYFFWIVKYFCCISFAIKLDFKLGQLHTMILKKKSTDATLVSCCREKNELRTIGFFFQILHLLPVIVYIFQLKTFNYFFTCRKKKNN